MSDLSIASAGLVSPLGIGVAQHVFFARAGAFVPPPPAFETAGGERVDALHCGFLGARLAMAERLVRLVEIAAEEALARWEALAPAGRIAVALVAPRRAGIDEGALRAAEGALARRCRAPIALTWYGEASAFAALAQVRAWLDADAASAALLVGVDSFASTDGLAEDRRRAQSPFCPPALPPSEGAAAVMLARADRARALRAEAARVVFAGTAAGQGTDDDDEILDGAAMTGLLRALPPLRIALVVGQEHVDDLRAREWHLASARAAPRFMPELRAETLERDTGRLGSAAGVAQLAYGVGLLRHRAAREVPPDAAFLAWAVSRDGLRGAALLQGVPS